MAVTPASSRASLSFFFFNDTATTEIYTLSLHDALPISCPSRAAWPACDRGSCVGRSDRDRKSTRLNSSHMSIAYAVFCLKKKKRPVSHRISQGRHYVASNHRDDETALDRIFSEHHRFFFTDPAPPAIYTLSLHAALPI